MRLIHRRVGRKLDRRRRLAAEHAAAPGGEADEVGAARDLPGGRHRVVAGRVHEHEALLGDRLRRSSAHRRDWCCRPSPSRRAIFPGSWSGRRPCCRAMGLAFISAPSRAVYSSHQRISADQFFADLAADRAAGQQMLGAIGLRRLRQNHGAAVPHQQIARRAQRRDWRRRRNSRRSRRIAAPPSARSPAPARASPCWRRPAPPARRRRRPPPSCGCRPSPGCPCSRSRPASFCSCIRPPIWLTSQPRPSTTTCGKIHMPRVAAERAAQQASAARSAVMPQPVLWVSATTPSTLGKSASGSSPVNGLLLEDVGDHARDMRAAIHLVRMPI